MLGGESGASGVFKYVGDAEPAVLGTPDMRRRAGREFAIKVVGAFGARRG